MAKDMIDYIGNLYNGSIRIQINSNLSDEICICRGVKQGDPLLTLLFNYVMEYCGDGLIEEDDIKVDSFTVTHLAFADDVVVFSDT